MFPEDIFGEEGFFTEEPEKTLGEKYREEYGEKREEVEKRGPPRLKDWYRKALQENLTFVSLETIYFFIFLILSEKRHIIFHIQLMARAIDR